MEKFSSNKAMYYMPPGLFEYMLIVSPGGDVYDKIVKEKQYFSRNYNQPSAIQTKPHITISNFLAWDNIEGTIVNGIQRIIKELKCFNIKLNNYSGFPSHTVFVRIQDPSPFTELTLRLKALAPYIKEANSPPARFMQYPFLSIARHLPAAVYENAIKDYSEKEFNASFNVTELILLRRKHQYEKCREVGVFRLQPNEHNN